ncbi:MAG: sulfite dehydrogenase [Emcibacteraceae bacterium]|nr:sulfite dehydrogenase [Emcibacteraceae bacterium]
MKQGNQTNRRRFLQTSIAGGVAALTSGATAKEIVLEPSRSTGRDIFETGTYGVPSQFATSARIKGSANGLHGASRTPLAETHGIITPSGLHFEVHHGGVPDIPPLEHKLLIHGMVDDAKMFTMEDIMRFPSVSRTYFLECSGNGEQEWSSPSASTTTVQATHGLTSCSEWTGVPLKLVLNEVGIRTDAKWMLAEGDDSSRMGRSIPMWKVLDDALLVYAQNGEFLRPEQGFPLRLFVPGFEGNMNVKWLHRLEFGDKPWWSHQEVARYSDPRPNGKKVVFSFYMDAKSVITSPSSTMRLNGPGFYEITGLAWSGKGKVARVEVSTDGGATWRDAHLQTPIMTKCHTRFRLPWNWNGRDAILQSRVTDDTGYVQPDYEQLYVEKSRIGMMHNNAIQSWKVAADGNVSNVHHV